MSQSTVFVTSFTNGILGPDTPMLGPVKSGGFIVANTAPGCWGPMITPAIRGGHEVTTPVAVEGAMPGDAILIRIHSLTVSSQGTSSGVDQTNGACAVGDPFVAAKCPSCGTLWPATHVEGIGAESIRCDECGAQVNPFFFVNGYTMAFNDERSLGITLNKAEVDQLAAKAAEFANLPSESIQHPVTTLAPSDLPGIVARVTPFLGQLGTTPAVNTPDSHNAGDFGQFLVDAPHDYAFKAEQLKELTDGHMDINRARAGAMVIAPVRVPGGGIYLGDMHAMQGDGEIAGHTTDVSGVAIVQVTLLKGLSLEGPLLIPVPEDLPYLAKPLTSEERAAAERLAAKWKVDVEESLPLAFIGTGTNLNDAVDCALTRAAHLLDMSVEEVKNRCTINGELQIGRYPGTVTACFSVPRAILEGLGLWDILWDQYG